MPAPCCSQLNHLKHALYSSPAALCLCILTPLAPGGIFSECSCFEHQSFPCASNSYVCGTHSSFVTKHSFILFPKLLKKKKKNKYTPKRGRENYFLYIGSTMSHPWIKHILLFFLQDLGFNMTLGSCSHYIELCPPPFGYSSKHRESLCCLLHHELMSMSCCLSLIIFHTIFQGNFLPSLSRPLCILSLSLMPNHLEILIKSLFKINKSFSLIIKIL
jgi:hypothetical protein